MHAIFRSTNDHDVITEIDGFERLIEIAKSDMRKVIPEQNSQAVALESKNGNTYHIVILNVLTDDLLDENELLNQMKKCNDTEIKKIICMWSEECFDMPSYAFRKLMCAMHERNINAEMLLSGENCLIKKTIFETFGSIDRASYPTE